MASKSKKAAQLVRYFASVYYYTDNEGKGMVGRFFHKNLFGNRPTKEWLKNNIQAELKLDRPEQVSIIAAIMVSKEEYEYQTSNNPL